MQAIFNFFWVLKKIAFQTAKVPRTSGYSKVIEPYRVKVADENSKTLDLGCGNKPRNPFGASFVYGIDLKADKENRILSADLAVESIPFGDSEFDYITAFDFLEHIPRVAYLPARAFPFVLLMNEIWRVLRPGGYFLSYTPVYPFPSAFQDPTHVNFITVNTFSQYFDNHHRQAKIYGFEGKFEVVSQALNSGHLITLLRKEIF